MVAGIEQAESASAAPDAAVSRDGSDTEQAATTDIHQCVPYAVLQEQLSSTFKGRALRHATQVDARGRRLCSVFALICRSAAEPLTVTQSVYRVSSRRGAGRIDVLAMVKAPEFYQRTDAGSKSPWLHFWYWMARMSTGISVADATAGSPRLKLAFTPASSPSPKAYQSRPISS